MTKEILSNELNRLASNDEKRTQTARLRDLLEEIEATLASGVTRAAVVETLAKNGFNLPLGSFNSTLHRLRKKRNNNTVPVSKQVGQVKATSRIPKTEDEMDDPTPISGTHNPSDLEAIIRTPVDLDALAKIGKKKRI